MEHIGEIFKNVSDIQVLITPVYPVANQECLLKMMTRLCWLSYIFQGAGEICVSGGNAQVIHAAYRVKDM